MKENQSPENCAKCIISNIASKSQMTHIQRFLSNALPSYILTYVRDNASTPQFTDLTGPSSVFTMIGELMIMADEQCGGKQGGYWIREWIWGNLYIECCALREIKVKAQETDSTLLALLKTSLQYVKNKAMQIYMRMLQIEVRLLLLRIDGREKDHISQEMVQIVKEICEIYPALKAEVSLMHPDISLPRWFQMCLSIISSKQNKCSKAYLLGLKMIMQQAQFIGPMEELFKQHIKSHLPTGQKTQINNPMAKEELPPKEDSASKAFSSSQSLKDKQTTFKESDVFRKKKRIIKDRYKTSEAHTDPSALQKTSQKTLPAFFSKKKNTSNNLEQDETTVNPNFKLYHNLNKRPVQRTIYDSKTFYIQSSSLPSVPNDLCYENSVAFSSTTYESNLISEQSSRKFSHRSKPLCLQDQDDDDEFCVPPTPRRNPIKTQPATTEQSLQFDEFTLS